MPRRLLAARVWERNAIVQVGCVGSRLDVQVELGVFVGVVSRAGPEHGRRDMRLAMHVDVQKKEIGASIAWARGRRKANTGLGLAWAYWARWLERLGAGPMLACWVGDWACFGPPKKGLNWAQYWT